MSSPRYTTPCRFTILMSMLVSVVCFIRTGFAQSECPEPPDALVEEFISDIGNDPAVAIDPCGNFVIAWDQFVESNKGDAAHSCYSSFLLTDGDEWVSADCNANGLPDECDLALPPPFGSYDCNDNDVPDECDIADETSCDANENGVPDECEIALETCDDLDEDDCCDEGESLMIGGGEGGGESTMGGEGGESSSESESSESESSGSQSPCAELTESECWDLYFEWAMEQCWGPNCEATGLEQYHAVRQKLAELGLTWPM